MPQYSERLVEAAENFLVNVFETATGGWSGASENENLPSLIDAAMAIVSNDPWEYAEDEGGDVYEEDEE